MKSQKLNFQEKLQSWRGGEQLGTYQTRVKRADSYSKNIRSRPMSVENHVSDGKSTAARPSPRDPIRRSPSERAYLNFNVSPVLRMNLHVPGLTLKLRSALTAEERRILDAPQTSRASTLSQSGIVIGSAAKLRGRE